MKKLAFILFVILVATTSCNAPHENPLDPENESSGMALISGTVQTVSLPRENISDALLAWENENFSTFSKRDGTFKFEIKDKRNGWLSCKKDGYFKDSVFVSWNNSNSRTIPFYLNEISKLTSFSATSSVLFLNDSSSSELIYINIRLKDRDNDIDSVFLRCNEFQFCTPLLYNVINETWSKTLTPDDFSITSIAQLIGKTFVVQVQDNDGRKIYLDGGQLTRILSLQPAQIFPNENAPVQIPFTCTWQAYPETFDYNYKIQIFRSEIPPQLVFEQNNIPKEETSLTIESELAPGNYMWTLEVKDEYGNKVRSKPVAFKIQN